MGCFCCRWKSMRERASLPLTPSGRIPCCTAMCTLVWGRCLGRSCGVWNAIRPRRISNASIGSTSRCPVPTRWTSWVVIMRILAPGPRFLCRCGNWRIRVWIDGRQETDGLTVGFQGDHIQMRRRCRIVYEIRLVSECLHYGAWSVISSTGCHEDVGYLCRRDCPEVRVVG